MIRRARRATEQIPPTLCLLPWLNLSIDVDGSSRPCCKFDHVDHVDGRPLLNLKDASLAEVWDSDGLVGLRNQFRSGDKPAACASCWAEEDAGVPSFRQTFLADRDITPEVDVDDLHPAQPRGLDLKLSNTCNLACRICGPVASSKWLNEELKAAPEPRRAGTFVAYLSENRRYLADNKLTGRPDDLALVETWAPRIEHLELTGGEPMLSKESVEVLELLAEHGDPGRISLQITTNATVIDDRITVRIPRFAAVTISLSIDDIGPRLEYQRHPARWDEVRANLDRYAEMVSASCSVFINATVSIFNAWDLADYLMWWREHFPDERIGFSLNFVHHPTEQCIQQLPEPAKDLVAARWAAHLAWSDVPARRRLDEALGFLRAETADPAQWSAFVSTTDDLDRRRDQRFGDVYPGLVNALEAAGLPTPSSGSRR